MKISVSFKNAIVDIICLLYILLFVYAATNKLIDFEEFQVQLAQSPLLSSFAGWVSWFIPIIELIISILLCIPKTRLLALYSSFSLMVMFSIYIVIMLNFSPFVPCSCGGILEKLSWNQHLVFNIIYTVIAIPAIIFLTNKMKNDKKVIYPLLSMVVLSILGVSIVTTLFIVSEDMIHHRNNFTRRFPHHPAEFIRDYQLASSSTYIAGVHNGKVYLGDSKNPLKILEFGHDLAKVNSKFITTNEPDRRFRMLRVAIKAPYFYLSDGIEAFTFRGNIKDWKASIWTDKLAYYNSFVPIDSVSAGIRAISNDTNENMIGVMLKGTPSSVTFNRKLLDKQIDGVFDTDGKLLYNDKHKKLIYVYLYRNEYVITDVRLQSKIIGNTIDTTTRAKIKVTYVDRIKTSKIASPMRIVNNISSTDGDYLFVNSRLMGQFEEEDMWDEASIIDVYNILTKAYLFSFYLYDKEGKKITAFVVDKGKIFTLAGNTLTVYNLNSFVFNKNK